MKVLVTGASGFLGSHVAEQLALGGHQVKALVRKTSNVTFLSTLKGVELCLGGVEHAGSLRAALEGAEAVIHCAGLVKARDEAEFFAVNTEGTRKLLDAAKQASPALRRFVHVSSLTVAGPSLDGKPVVNGAAPRPVTMYGRSKLAAEELVRAARDEVRSVILRPPMIYGPRDGEAFAFFQSVSRRFLPYLGDGKNTMSVVYGPDAAKACIRAIEADVPSGSTYFVDDGEVYVWMDMLADIERAVGKEALVRLSIPFFVARGAAAAGEAYGKLAGKAVMLTRDKLNELSAPHWVCSSLDTRRALGWQPEVKWPEGTRRTAAWYRDNGWL